MPAATIIVESSMPEPRMERTPRPAPFNSQPSAGAAGVASPCEGHAQRGCLEARTSARAPIVSRKSFWRCAASPVSPLPMTKGVLARRAKASSAEKADRLASSFAILRAALGSSPDDGP